MINIGFPYICGHTPLTCQEGASKKHLYLLTQVSLSDSSTIIDSISRIARATHGSHDFKIIPTTIGVSFGEGKRSVVTINKLGKQSRFQRSAFWSLTKKILEGKHGTIAFTLFLFGGYGGAWTIKDRVVDRKGHAMIILIFWKGKTEKAQVTVVDPNGAPNPTVDIDIRGVLQEEIFPDQLRDSKIVFWKPSGLHSQAGPQEMVSEGVRVLLRTLFPHLNSDLSRKFLSENLDLESLQGFFRDKEVSLDQLKSAFAKHTNMTQRRASQAVLDLLMQTAVPSLSSKAKQNVADLLRAWRFGTCQLWGIWFLYLIAVTGVRSLVNFQTVYKNALDIILEDTLRDVQQEAVVLSEYLGRFIMQLGSLHNFTYNRNSGGKGHILLNNQVVINDAGSKSLSLPRKWKTA
jgi:hypothetical protein